MNMIEDIKNKYGDCNVIFERDILALGYTKEDIQSNLKENEFEEVNNEWLDEKIYSFVEYSDFLEKYCKSSFGFYSIINYYVGYNQEYGFLFGFCSLNGLGASTQICGSYQLKSVLVDEKTVYTNKKGCTITIYPMDIADFKAEDSWYYRYADAFNNCLSYFDNPISYVIDTAINDRGMNNIEKLINLITNEKVLEDIKDVLTRK